MSILSFEFLAFGLLLLIAYYSFPLKGRPWVLLTFSVLFVYLNSVTELNLIELFTKPKLPEIKILIPLGALLLTVLTFLIPFKKPQKWRPWALILSSLALVFFSGAASLMHLLTLTLIVWGGALGLQSLRNHEADMETAARKLSKSGPMDWADDRDWQATVRAESVLKNSARGFVTARKWLLAFLLVLDLGSMAFIKFYPTVAKMLNDGWTKAHPLLIWDMIVPLGLSYFTFQSAGYLIDVSRGKAEAPKNPLRTLLFVGYFMQLPQGPISTWKELQGQLTTGHRFDATKFVSGFQLMMWGYFKKLVLADRLALVTEEALKLKTSLTGWLALGSAILYAIRLYADFSGGLDVMRGLSRMVGVELPENFRRPFFATSVAEYWRRWHITLGTWFRSYLLYPLTASKFGVGLGRIAGKILGKKTGRAVPAALGTILVFVLIGIWHGFSLNALNFGLYFGLLMALSTLLDPFWKWLNKALRLPKWLMTPFRMIRTWVLIVIPQFFAFTTTLEKATFMMEKAFSPVIYYFNGVTAWIAGLFSGGGTEAAALFSAEEAFSAWSFETFVSRCTKIMSPMEWIIAGSALVIILAVDIICEHKKDFCDGLAKPKFFFIRWPLMILLILAILVFGCYGQGYDSAAFLYTQF